MLRCVLEKCRTVVHTDKSKGTSSAGPFSPSMALGSELYWEGLLLAEKMNKVQRLLELRTILSGLYSGPGLLPLARPKHRGPGFVMGTSLLPALVAPQQTEKGGRPPNTYLREADGEESVWDAFTSPSGGTQQEAREPTAPKSDFHTSSHPRMSYPSGRRKQSIKQVWLWCARGFRQS